MSFIVEVKSRSKSPRTRITQYGILSQDRHQLAHPNDATTLNSRYALVHCGPVVVEPSVRRQESSIPPVSRPGPTPAFFLNKIISQSIPSNDARTTTVAVMIKIQRARRREIQRAFSPGINSWRRYPRFSIIPRSTFQCGDEPFSAQIEFFSFEHRVPDYPLPWWTVKMRRSHVRLDSSLLVWDTTHFSFEQDYLWLGQRDRRRQSIVQLDNRLLLRLRRLSRFSLSRSTIKTVARRFSAGLIPSRSSIRYLWSSFRSFPVQICMGFWDRFYRSKVDKRESNNGELLSSGKWTDSISNVQARLLSDTIQSAG
ncbi:hypothetical protein C8J56DRAFT_1091464 [Mycena floridula]|nr:hypothetical protein C8J56DRAFT_1091464 [Mycena floridula]